MNSQGLLNLRKSGKTVSGLVIASLLPDLEKFTGVVHVNPSDDFSGFHGLRVCVASVSTQMPQSFAVIDGLLRYRPESIFHWAVDTGKLASVYELGQKLIIPTLGNNEFTSLIRKLKSKSLRNFDDVLYAIRATETKSEITGLVDRVEDAYQAGTLAMNDDDWPKVTQAIAEQSERVA